MTGTRIQASHWVVHRSHEAGWYVQEIDAAYPGYKTEAEALEVAARQNRNEVTGAENDLEIAKEKLARKRQWLGTVGVRSITGIVEMRRSG